MSRYFSYFPIIRYNNKLVRDITKRTNLIEENFNTPYLLLPYTVKQGEKPEDISYYYYGSVDYTWLVLFSNNIIDPYLEWVMTDDQLHKYIIEKYKDESGKTGIEVLEWSLNETITDNILFYYNEENNIRISKESFVYVDNPQDFRPIRVYEYEQEMNFVKGEIKLVDKKYLGKIESELKDLMLK